MNGSLQVQLVDESIDNSVSQPTVSSLRNNPKSPLGNVLQKQQKTQEDEEDTQSVATSIDEPEPPSLIRQNLLGPLTFDDLYYT